MSEQEIRLTQFSPGAGCGCKISSANLDKILSAVSEYPAIPQQIVGNSSKDDAAVYDLGDGYSVISTTDFFTPIVDDPFDFGRIASVNAISDIYAMGGRPLMAIAILGWPVEKLSLDVASNVIEGARRVCDEAGIALAGGHSIEIADPVFGLAVTGHINTELVKQNNKAKAGSTLYLTKHLGIGIIATAEKRGESNKDDILNIVNSMTTLNSAGMSFARIPGVNAMTDVTGFGFLGHLLEICEGSNVIAEIDMDKIPLLPNLNMYIEKKCFPGGTFRNFKSYGQKIAELTEREKVILCDPQTSGGLLVSVEEDSKNNFLKIASDINQQVYEVGRLLPNNGAEKIISISKN